MRTPTHKLVLLAFADFADDAGYCWPSIARVAVKSQVSERHVQRVVADLKRDGLLAISEAGGGRKTPRYQIRGDRLSPLRDDGDDGDAGVASAPAVDTPGVTPEGARGDAHVTPGVTPMSPKPSVNRHKEPSLEPAAAAGAAGEKRGIIFELYEQTIGTIDAFMGTRLVEAEGEYTEECLRHSFAEASTHNVRNWKYVETVLRRHKTEGCYGKTASGRNGRRDGGARADGPDMDAWKRYAAQR